jgi:FlaA1/EpsC-like NDP-sugar epimerase
MERNEGDMDDYQEHYKDKTVLITGGAGAIGSNHAPSRLGAISGRSRRSLGSL